MKKPVFFTLLAIGILAYFYTLSSSNPISTHHWSPISQREKEEDNEEEEELTERAAQEKLMTQDPALGYVPTDRLVEAQLVAGRLKSTSRQSSTYSLAWTERGPNNVGGRTRSLLIDRADPSGNTVFAGSVSGGLWRTNNFKAVKPFWSPVSSISANLAISCLAQDPGNHTIMYAGTGEGYNNVDAIQGLGIYKSIDGGTSWSLLAATTKGGANFKDFGSVQKIVVYDNGNVYASGISTKYCNNGGILRSTNGGTTWSRVIGNYNGNNSCSGAFDFLGYDIVESKNGDLYASVMDKSTADTTIGKIYRSPAGTTVGNAGTWINITPPPATASYWQRIVLACSPIDNNRIYALLQGTGSAIGGIKLSTDAGASWKDISNTTNWCDNGNATSTDFSRGQAWYDLALAIKPDDDQTILAGGVDLFKSTNSGTTWSQTSQWAGGCGTLPVIHSDIHNIYYLPGSATEYILVTDGGIYYTANDGASYVDKSAGYNTVQYYSVAMHPASGSNYMLAGAQDNGTHKFNTAGLGTVSSVSGGDGSLCFIDQKNPAVQISGFPFLNYVISRNGGATFSLSAMYDGGRFINPADYDTAQQVLYCGYNAGLIARIDHIGSGTLSANAFSFPLESSRMVSAVKVDPMVANRVWFAFSTADGVAAQVPRLYYMDNAQASTPAAPVAVSLPNLPAGSYISSMDMDKENSAHLLFTVSNYGVASIWESMDAGVSWSSLDNNGVNLPDMPVRSAQFLPAGTNFTGRISTGGIMLATELGVWTTTTSNGSTTEWIQSNGLPNVRVDMVRLRPSDNTVVAATHGRGLFTTTLNATLPVALLDFKGQAEGTHIGLSWSTSIERNSSHFIISKSLDGITYTAIGKVNAMGTSNQLTAYSFLDSHLSEYNYYRLTIVDKDGHSEYSKVVYVKIQGMPQQVKVLTNPFHDQIGMQWTKLPRHSIDVQLFDQTGHAVWHTNMAATGYALQLPINKVLPAGMYILKTTIDGEVFTNKLVKQ